MTASPNNLGRIPPVGCLVLIADDDADTRLLFRTMLELDGHRVIEAKDGEETVHLAESAGPDLILIDGSLPRVDGFDATRRIRRWTSSKRIPIVFVTGHAEPRYVTMARDAGCDEYLVKPIDFDELGGVLEKYLAKNGTSVCH